MLLIVIKKRGLISKRNAHNTIAPNWLRLECYGTKEKCIEVVTNTYTQKTLKS